MRRDPPPALRHETRRRSQGGGQAVFRPDFHLLGGLLLLPPPLRLTTALTLAWCNSRYFHLEQNRTKLGLQTSYISYLDSFSPLRPGISFSSTNFRSESHPVTVCLCDFPKLHDGSQKRSTHQES